MRKMRKIAALLCVSAMCISLAACSGGESNQETADENANSAAQDNAGGSTPDHEAPESGKFKIGVSMNAMDDYQTEWYGYLEEYAGENNLELIMTNAESKVDKQLSDIESLIALEPDVIIIRATDSSGIVTGFEACEAAGIPTIDSGFGSDYENTLKILSSQVYLCSLQAKYCIDYLEANPDASLKCGYIWGAQGVSTTQDRYDGWHDTLMEAQGDRVEILAEKVCNWSATETMACVEDWIQAYPDMNCIVAMSDEMALAAANVLQAANIGTDECIVIGIDGSDAAQQALRDGTLNATVYTSKKADARLTLDYALKLANGEDFKGQTIDPGDEISDLITKDTIDEVLERLN